VWLDANQHRYLAQTFNELIAQIVLVYRPEDVSTMSENGFTHGTTAKLFYTATEFNQAVQAAISANQKTHSAGSVIQKKNSSSTNSNSGTDFCFLHGFGNHTGKQCKIMLPFQSVCNGPMNTSNDSCTHYGITTSSTGLSKQVKAQFIEKLQAALAKKEKA
jgi:hypothetical protein